MPSYSNLLIFDLHPEGLHRLTIEREFRDDQIRYRVEVDFLDGVRVIYLHPAELSQLRSALIREAFAEIP